MSHHFAKPENALKRAEELLHVGQQQAALDSLHDVLSSKRHRTWTPVIEQVITKYLDICISLKKGRMAKDGLIQYRIICQQVNVGSLEDVLRHLMAKVDADATAAMVGAEDVAQSLVSDLDADETPESILLSAMTGDDAATRSEREAVTPWLKFVWETYRTVLEILRSQVKLEALYAETAQKAFAFCVKYKRATEMRRLCELLRNHLAALSKYQPREAAAAGLPVDGLGMHLEVRYAQLNAAADLELWQESYRTIEDIHALTLALKKPPKTSMQLLYYLKLSQVFFVSDKLLLHGYCLGRLVFLSRTKKVQPDAAEMRSLATAALLAALVAPLSPADAAAAPGFAAPAAPTLDVDQDAEKARRIAAVLGFGTMPSRDGLLHELRARGVLAAAEPSVAALVEHLEAAHVPMSVAREAEAVLASLDADARCRAYGPQLRRTVCVRMLQQLSRVYTSLSLRKAVALIRVLPVDETELVMARAAKRGLVPLSIDAAAGVLRFGAGPLGRDARARGALSTVFVALCSAAASTARDALGTQALADRATGARSAALAKLAAGATGEHARMLQRKLVIERRKEELERQAHRQDEARRERAEREAAEAQEQERARLAAEARRRESEKLERERAEEEHDSKRKLAEALAEQRKTLKKAMKKTGWDVETDVDKLASMPTQLLVTEQKELMADEREQFEKRLEALRKRADYLERARREAEAPLLRTARDFALRADREAHERASARFVEAAAAQRAHALAQRDRLHRVTTDKAAFESQRFAARQAIHEAACAARNEALAEAREARRDERRDARIRRKEAEAAALAEAAARREAERVKAEREVARRAAIEAERAKLAEIEERKRAKEVEIELREQAQRLEASGPTWADRDGDDDDGELPQMKKGPPPAAPAPPAPSAAGASGSAPAPAAGGERPAGADRSWENQPLRDSRAGLGGPARGGGERGGERWQPGGARGGGGDDRFSGRGGGGDRFGSRGGGDDRFGSRGGGDDRFGSRGGGDDRFGSRGGGDDRFGSRGGGDDRFSGRGGGDDRFGSRGGGDDRFGSRGGGDDRFGSRGGGDDRFGSRGGGDDRFGSRGGGDDRFGSRGGGDDRFGSRGGGDDRFGSRGGGDDRFGSRGGGGGGEHVSRLDGPPRDGPPRDGPPRDGPPRPTGGGDSSGRWR